MRSDPGARNNRESLAPGNL